MLACLQLEELLFTFLVVGPLRGFRVREDHEERGKQDFCARHEDEEGEGHELNEVLLDFAQSTLVAEGVLVVLASRNVLLYEPGHVPSEDLEAVDGVGDFVLYVVPLVLQPV